MRDRQSERGGGLHVGHQLEPGRLLDRQVRGFSAFRILSTMAAVRSEFSRRN